MHRPFFEVDGALVRVRVPGGALDPAAAHAIATAAVDVGAGPVELTNRANLQVRGIPIDAVAALRDALVAAGVTAPDPPADERRNVLASPTAGVDADELVDPRPLVAAVADRLASAGPARALSPKFGVLVDAGGAVHLRGRGQDLALGAGRDEHGTVRYEVRIGDALPYPPEGGDRAWSVAPDRALEVVDAVIDAAAPFGRARDLVAALGPDRVWRDLADRTGDALTGPATLVGPAAPSLPAVGVHAQRQPQQVWIGLAVVLGRLDPTTLLALADLAASVGGGLRITPWGGLVLADVDRRDASRVVAASRAARVGVRPRPSGQPRGDLRGKSRLRSRPGRHAVRRPGARGPPRRPRPRAASGVGPRLGLRQGLRTAATGAGVARRGADPRHLPALRRPAARRERTLRRAAPVRARPVCRDRRGRERGGQPGERGAYLRDGPEIYRRSFAIIRAETDLSRVPPDLETAAVRMVHACGMVDLVDDLDWSDGAGHAIRAALGGGATVLTDSTMLASGITRRRLPARNAVWCAIADPDVMAAATTDGTTRAAAAVDAWGRGSTARSSRSATHRPRCSGCWSSSTPPGRVPPRSSACRSGSSAPPNRSGGWPTSPTGSRGSPCTAGEAAARSPPRPSTRSASEPE